MRSVDGFAAVDTARVPFRVADDPSIDTARYMDAAFSDIEDIIADIAAGKMVIMVDDENRENEAI